MILSYIKNTPTFICFLSLILSDVFELAGTFSEQSNPKASEVLQYLKRFSMAPAFLSALFSVGVASADSDEVSHKIS